MWARPVTCVRHQSTIYTSDSPVLVDSVAVPATVFPLAHILVSRHQEDRALAVYLTIDPFPDVSANHQDVDAVIAQPMNLEVRLQ
jgi:hypothetical protein